ncbi:class A beta-lactamase [Rhodopseudomonas sp. BR0M22]|uniref:class A beta-lactamase n=2 Tax=unclassified Rhodopseudomonas TaxID=2638247 RepID=UPI0013E0080A|nr:class A beta-lactamase [Rhodopseudomonas sp. BR0M22]NEW92519.1 class A beta-lactamase [Rhodopseudomonas sp. BR0M22]
MVMTRRAALTAAVLAASAMATDFARAENEPSEIEGRLRDLERSSGGRLGVAILDSKDGRLVGHRLDERFALCSTFKALAVAFVLARVDRGEESLDRRIAFTERDLVSPFTATKPHVGAEGMTVAALCEAAITVSDSTAANLLLDSFGGPSALTAYLRSLGDPVTRVDHRELELNIVRPGEIHDTTSPRAMVGTLQRLLLGSALSASSRARLTTWMIEARDAAARRLRVGLPNGWRIANKPGTWAKISTNDIGVIWPPGRDPIIVAAYLGEAPGSIKDQEAVLAQVARIIAERV